MYNITRVRVCFDYEHILDAIKQQLLADIKDSEGYGDTLRINLDQEALNNIETLSDNIQQEIDHISKQKSSDSNEIRSDNLSTKTGEVSDSTVCEQVPYIRPGVVNHLAQTQKWEELERKVKTATGNCYFYQLDDETNCYLHPLCLKILLNEYGSYDNLPLEVESTILEIEELSMNEMNRKKYKAISHLPKAAEFKFLEVDMTSLASTHTLQAFEKQIKGRESVRQKKLEIEQKYNDKAKLIEERKYEYFLKTNLTVTKNRKSKLVPEWDTNNPDESSWFTLDGQEIKSNAKKAWEGENEEAKVDNPSPEVKEMEDNNKENEESNDASNPWNDFKVASSDQHIDEFPALGGGPSYRTEKIPVIKSIVKSKSKVTKPVKKKPATYTNDNGEKQMLNLTDFEAQFLAQNDTTKFDIASAIQFTTVTRGNRKKKKRRT